MTRVYDLLIHPSNNGLSIVAISLVVIILIDTFLIKFYDLFDKNIILINYKKIVFILLLIFCLFFQFLINNYIKNLPLDDKNNSRMHIRFNDKLYRLFLYTEVVVFVILILQILYLNYYNSLLLILIVSICYILPLVFLGQCTRLFLSWLQINRNLTLFLYFISLSFIMINLVTTTLVVGIGIGDRPEVIRQFVGGTMDISSGKYGLLATILKITSILSFVSIWIITALIMLSTGSTRRNGFLRLTFLILPLVYFLISYFAEDIFYNLLFPYFQSDPINASLVFSAIFMLSKPIGGLTFGLLYWRISKLVRINKFLREFMILTGIGFVFLYSANQATLLVLTPFPPFGIITITLLLPSVYLVFIGIFKSASIASVDSELRQYIYRTAKESKLLEIISNSEMEMALNKVVNKAHQFVDRDPEKSNNLQMESYELRSYIEEVINELKQEENKNRS